MNKYIKLFIKNLGDILREKNLSQTDLAKMMKLHVSSVNRWFSGDYAPKLDTISAIAEALETTPAFLLRSDNEPASPISWDKYAADIKAQTEFVITVEKQLKEALTFSKGEDQFSHLAADERKALSQPLSRGQIDALRAVLRLPMLEREARTERKRA